MIEESCVTNYEFNLLRLDLQIPYNMEMWLKPFLKLDVLTT